jgi:hypothetical protein
MNRRRRIAQAENVLRGLIRQPKLARSATVRAVPAVATGAIPAPRVISVSGITSGEAWGSATLTVENVADAAMKAIAERMEKEEAFVLRWMGAGGGIGSLVAWCMHLPVQYGAGVGSVAGAAMGQRRFQQWCRYTGVNRQADTPPRA